MSKKPHPDRRTFSVRGQLLGKLGPRCFGRLLDQLQAASAPPRPARRRRPRRSAKVAA